MFTPADRDRVRSTQNLMTVIDVRSVNGRKAYSYRDPHFWNTLNNEARLFENKNSFKMHLTKLILLRRESSGVMLRESFSIALHA